MKVILDFCGYDLFHNFKTLVWLVSIPVYISQSFLSIFLCPPTKVWWLTPTHILSFILVVSSEGGLPWSKVGQFMYYVSPYRLFFFKIVNFIFLLFYLFFYFVFKTLFYWYLKIYFSRERMGMIRRSEHIWDFKVFLLYTHHFSSKREKNILKRNF